MQQRLIFFALILLIIAGCTTTPASPGNPPSSAAVPAAAPSSAYETKSSQSAVTVELTPQKLDQGRFTVEIKVDTHSVDLTSFDLKKMIVLYVGDASYKPIAAPSLSGHHASGNLEFDVGSKPESFMIMIEGLPDIQTRHFEWKKDR